MIVVLGFSHVDHWLAVRWLRWASWLCMKQGGDSSAMTLVLFGARRITAEQWDELHRMHFRSDCMFHVEPVVCPDERETGYPASANHLFFRALEHCENKYPGEPVLWCEADTTPMWPGWAQAIREEYAECGKPFMGFRSNALCAHMPGVAVYSGAWREEAPCMTEILSLRSAWDTGCAHQIVPKMAVAKTIHQIWRPRRIDFSLLAAIPGECALFHQCKTGALAALLAHQLGGGWE